MNSYKIFRPTYKAAAGAFYHLHLEPVGLVQAPTAEDAIKLAKKRGFLAPIVAPAKEKLQ